MENFEINIDYQEWSKKPAIIDFIAALFDTKDTASALLKLAIERENNEYGGSPEVEQLSLENISYDTELKTGRFRVVYHIKFHFTCSDYRKEKGGQTSDWSFKFDLENVKLHFQGPAYLDLRSTADEF
ncbi:MAG: hypothetical protein ABIN91_09805 [Mucilaginibacter sp.]|uniref:hypothetical protein n=1 Tax=Mucilaginibacter sp. TaxID=1882438 RepID=UPI0032654605